MSLAQVAYCSKARHSFSEQDLDEMLATARIKNKAFGLSGLLLYQDAVFLQFLEGERHAVDDMLETIQADARHDVIKLIWRRAIPARDFGDWQMGYLRSKLVSDRAGFVDVLRTLSMAGIQLDACEAGAHRLIDIFKDDQLRDQVRI